MTILAAAGLVLAFMFWPIGTVLGAIGFVIAGLCGAVIGFIIGAFIDCWRCDSCEHMT